MHPKSILSHRGYGGRLPLVYYWQLTDIFSLDLSQMLLLARSSLSEQEFSSIFLKLFFIILLLVAIAARLFPNSRINWACVADVSI